MSDAARDPYRYRLRRDLGAGSGTLLWVLGNPSRADERRDDPTVRRCVAFTRAWGYAALEVVNLFAWRSPWPSALRSAADPVGRHGDAAIAAAVAVSDAVVAGWGRAGRWRGRDAEVLVVLRAAGVETLDCLGVNRDGTPRHPLYVASGTPRVPLPDASPADLSPPVAPPATPQRAAGPRR